MKKPTGIIEEVIIKTLLLWLYHSKICNPIVFFFLKLNLWKLWHKVRKPIFIILKLCLRDISTNGLKQNRYHLQLKFLPSFRIVRWPITRSWWRWDILMRKFKMKSCYRLTERLMMNLEAGFLTTMTYFTTLLLLIPVQLILMLTG